MDALRELAFDCGGPDSLAAKLFCDVPAFAVANWARFVAAIGAGTEAGFEKAGKTRLADPSRIAASSRAWSSCVDSGHSAVRSSARDWRSELSASLIWAMITQFAAMEARIGNLVERMDRGARAWLEFIVEVSGAERIAKAEG